VTGLDGLTGEILSGFPSVKIYTNMTIPYTGHPARGRCAEGNPPGAESAAEGVPRERNQWIMGS